MHGGAPSWYIGRRGLEPTRDRPGRPGAGTGTGAFADRTSAIYVADFDIDPGIVQTSNDLPSRVMQGGGPLSRLREGT
ncbi:MAG: hypothetical protein ACREXY_05900 [Gammaproteobacteria bacterium]